MTWGFLFKIKKENLKTMHMCCYHEQAPDHMTGKEKKSPNLNMYSLKPVTTCEDLSKYILRMYSLLPSSLISVSQTFIWLEEEGPNFHLTPEQDSGSFDPELIYSCKTGHRNTLKLLTKSVKPEDGTDLKDLTLVSLSLTHCMFILQSTGSIKD